MKCLLAFAMSLIVALAGTSIIIRLGTGLCTIDRPSDDRWKARSIPRIGGVAILAGLMAAIAVIGFPLQKTTAVVLSGALSMFTLGVVDDMLVVSLRVKLATQSLIALAIVLLGVRMDIMPAAASIPLTVLWIVGITNAFNLIDNMDGLSAGTAVIASMAFFLLSWKSTEAVLPIMALGLAGSCLGFLRFNFSPARVIMGDCGSLLLGFSMSMLAILGCWQKPLPMFEALTVPVLILGYAVFDTTFVAVSRLKTGRRPWIGGTDHSSHRLVALGMSEKQAVPVLYSLSIVGSCSAGVVLNSSLMIGIPLVVILGTGATAFGWILAKATA